MSKFKVGDRVRCVEPKNPNIKKKESSWFLGDTFKICKVGDNYSGEIGNIYWKKDQSTGYYEDGLELVEKKDPIKYEDLIL